MKNTQEKKKRYDIISLEEEETNTIVFAAAEIVSIMAFIAVVIFMDGSAKDWIILTATLAGFLVHVLGKRISWVKRYAKYLNMTISFWCTCVLIFTNDGKYAAVTQVYFMFLTVAIAYYDVKIVLFHSIITIVSTISGLVFFPEAMLKVDTLSIWCFILAVFIMASFFSVIIARRMRLLIEKARQIKAYEDELIYFKQLEEKEEKHSEFIHNMNHYFVAIGELARIEQCEQIVNLVEELNGKLLQNTRVIYTNHKVLNAILSEKANEASDKQIETDIYVEPVIGLGGIADGDLAVMLGNLFDNAIEAAEHCEREKKKISVRIYMEKEGRVCVVKIVNYYAYPRVRKNTGFISTKKNRELHGIGIKSVKSTAKKYNGYLQCMLEEEKFSSVLILPIE